METKAKIYKAKMEYIKPTPIMLNRGAHLFLDEFLIESSSNIARQVNRPVRDPEIPNPLVTGKEDGCFQPYMTVIRDPESKKFRLWYGHRVDESKSGESHIGYMESEDGINWSRPPFVLKDPAPIQFGTSVIDEGLDYPYPERRFKFSWWKDGGLKVASSPDGLNWTAMSKNIVLPHNHDINSIFYDSIRKRYMATISVYETGEKWSGNRRVTMQSYSQDLLNWEKPHYILTPDDTLDKGETQFYAMDGFLVRGDLVIGMVKVLRDDLKADDPPDPPNQYGIGYTALAWTRDGETWTRDQEVFFDRNMEKGTWDHAHAWIDEQLIVNDEVYLYYCGYARGHKVNRFEERQIGLLRMKLDRYVSRVAGDIQGYIQTPLLTFDADSMTINAKIDGEARVRILDTDGKTIKGFDWEDCASIRGDSIAHPVKWKGFLTELKDKKIKIEFSLKQAEFYGFELY